MGVEPIRCHHQRILSPSRLPIPTHRLICCLYSILQAWQKIKIYFALIFTPQIRSKSTLDIPHIIGLSFFFGGVFPYHAGIFPGNRCGKGQRGNLCYAGNHLPDPHFLAVVPSGAGVDLVGVPAFRNHLRRVRPGFVSAPDPPLAGSVKSQAAEKEFCAAAKTPLTSRY